MQATKATFFRCTRVENGKPMPAGAVILWIAQGVGQIFMFLFVMAVGVVLLFLSPPVGAFVCLLAFVLLFYGGSEKFFTGWYGSCPACNGALWLRARAQDAGPHGLDCPTCKNRVILRGGRFEPAPRVIV